MLEARSLAFEGGGSRRIQPLQLELAGGQIHVALGPNGSGKSTLLALLSGLLEPGSGEVLLRGRNLHRYSLAERARHLAVMLQSQPLDFAFPVREVIAMGGYPLDLSLPELDQRIEQLARGLDIAHLLERSYLSLSGGEAQRVQLARVLAQRGREPSVIMLDEPLTALDLKHQHQALMLLQQLAVEGHSIFIVLHDLNLAACYADHVLLMREGDLVAQGQCGEVMTAETLSALYDVRIERYESSGGQALFSSAGGR
ncbi:heme ABC transporter ATP-binding protein [Marinobacterium mangrovicola]|uniref:Iron complex transport system ATP-binding protein n=1 Tax=Marinobacterium mangrovicola TaxID=1476959 RepID=A0A4R1GDT4_9GAMM|nr:heme ABC transporter ATP-binding protein [Marinobacterium mangrovicola]TCK04991.1 iron complex transport system ATP-binding protein [Marinobacterium mangrovicola]